MSSVADVKSFESAQRTVRYVAGMSGPCSPSMLCSHAASLNSISASMGELRGDADAALVHLLSLERAHESEMVAELSELELSEFQSAFNILLDASAVDAAAALVSSVMGVCGARRLADASDLVVVDDRCGVRQLRYEPAGRFAGLFSRAGDLVRVFDRGDYHSTVTAMPAAFVVDASGVELVVAGSGWDQLSVFDASSGEVVAGPFGDGDPFIGRARSDSSGRFLAFDAWAWHPVSFLGVVAVDDLLAGQSPVFCASAVDYLFDRPFCWIDRPGDAPLLASLGAELPEGVRPVLADADDPCSFLDVRLAVEFIDVFGETVAVCDVADRFVSSDELRDFDLTVSESGVVVSAAGVEVGIVALPGADVR